MPRRTEPPGHTSESEESFLRWLEDLVGHDILGDDVAVLELDGRWALTTDSQISGVHYPPGLDPAFVARRLLAVNLSDLAASGARPAWALSTVASPPEWDRRRFLAALVEAGRAADVVLAGGDVARAPVPAVTLTLLGRIEPGHRNPGRDRGRPGDDLWLGGTVGESAIGRHLLAAGARIDGTDLRLPEAFRDLEDAASRAVLRHLEPSPQLELGRWLAGRKRAAAIDLSDGLAKDLHRLARASGTGALLEVDALPLPEGGEELASRLATDLVAEALGGGEDYVLLFALPRDEDPPPVGRRVGRLTDPDDGIHQRRGGEVSALPAAGWDHLSPG